MATRALVLGLGVGSLAAGAEPARAQVPPPERQIEWAVAAAPEKLRADATVLGYSAGGKLMTLRKGTGLLVCLGDNPTQPNHHVACYHRDLEPFMSRGRELRAQGLQEAAIDSARLAEIKSGKLKLPAGPAALYQLVAPPGNVDAATGEVKNARSLHVVYLPYATAESTGLSLTPIKGPWLMDAGMPWAHIMIAP
jgi:hypothetical protein